MFACKQEKQILNLFVWLHKLHVVTLSWLKSATKTSNEVRLTPSPPCGCRTMPSTGTVCILLNKLPPSVFVCGVGRVGGGSSLHPYPTSDCYILMQLLLLCLILVGASTLFSKWYSTKCRVMCYYPSLVPLTQVRRPEVWQYRCQYLVGWYIVGDHWCGTLSAEGGVISGFSGVQDSEGSKLVPIGHGNNITT